MHWLDHLPFTLLLAAALFLGLAPFVPEPHVVEKLRMLAGGDLRRPLDIFDLCFHLLPLALLLFKLGRIVHRKRTS
ncbi:MAG: RND transporter [Desulfobulbaceae bacterium]